MQLYNILISPQWNPSSHFTESVRLYCVVLSCCCVFFLCVPVPRDVKTHHYQVSSVCRHCIRFMLNLFLACREFNCTFSYFTYKHTMLFPGLHGGVLVSTVASQQEGSCFKSHLGPFCVEFACSLCACVGSLWVSLLLPTVQKHEC